MTERAGDVTTVDVVKCPRCGRQEWHRERGPDCMYAVCRCGHCYDIGWGPNARYFPDEAGMTNEEWWRGGK